MELFKKVMKITLPILSLASFIAGVVFLICVVVANYNKNFKIDEAMTWLCAAIFFGAAVILLIIESIFFDKKKGKKNNERSN
jgi:uncharacterized membrane protein